MSEPVNTQIVPTAERNTKLIVQDSSAIGYLMDTAKFEHCFRIAKLMATASLIPEHLRIDTKTKQLLMLEEVTGNCFLVVNQALRWNMDPFSVAPETYVVGGKLAYQGKLIAAVVNALGGLEERLSYSFSGTVGRDDFTITVAGRFKGEAAPRTVTLSVGQAKTSNQMWTKDPEQKLVYSGVTKWARRYCPEVVLGIILEDEYEAELRNVTPPADHVVNAIKQIEAPADEPAAPRRATRTAPAKTEAPASEAQPEPQPEPAKEETEAEKAAAYEYRKALITRIGTEFKRRRVDQATVENHLKEIGWLKHPKLSLCTNPELEELETSFDMLDAITPEQPAA